MAQQCQVPGCDRPYAARGYCGTHWSQWKRSGGEPVIANTRKFAPYPSERMSTLGVCSVEGCERPIKSRRLCGAHYARLREAGDLNPTKPIRRQSKQDVNARRINSNGYVVLYRPGHPNAHRSGQILEHVVVMGEMLGRPLFKGEEVHHKNGHRADNTLTNLELWTSSHPRGQRVADLIEFSVEILKRYRPDLLLGPRG